jgi:predicted MarR family transcription regulator
MFQYFVGQSGSHHHGSQHGRNQNSGRVIARTDVRRIVSSEHLVSERCPELSELEFGLIIASHAFGRWMTRCMAGAGVKDMTETEILVVHHVNHRGPRKEAGRHLLRAQHRGHPRRLLCAEEARQPRAWYPANGAARKSSGRPRKQGSALCERYRQVREACLMPGFSGADEENVRIGDLARLLRTISGRYDQGARAASSI